MLAQANIVNTAQPKDAEIVPQTFKGKLQPLINQAQTKKVPKKSQAGVESALVQSLKSGDQDNIDWVIKHEV